VRGQLERLGVLVAVVGVVLVFSGLAYGASGEQAVRSAEEAAGAAAVRIETALRAAQLNASDETLVRAVVDAYFNLRYESGKHGVGLDLGLVIDGSTVCGRALYYHEMGKLRFTLAVWKVTGTTYTDFRYRPEYRAVRMQGDEAVVEVRPWVDILGAPIDFEDGGELHVIKLARGPQGWLIVEDMYSDGLSESYPRGTDWAVAEKDLLLKLEAYDARAIALLTPQSTGTGQFGTLTSHYVAYNRIKASWYGKTYTNNDHGSSTTGYQYLFKAWPGTDCQNFVSQCVWYGFGGTLGASYINGHLYPMLDGVPGTPSWWCDAYGAVPSGTWTVVPTFYDMVTSNYTNDKLGVQGTSANMQNTLNDLDIGDYIVHNDALTPMGHVYIVTMLYDGNADGRHSYNEIYVSAHSGNIQNHQLSAHNPDPFDLIIVRILRYRDA